MKDSESDLNCNWIRLNLFNRNETLRLLALKRLAGYLGSRLCNDLPIDL